MVCKDYVQSFMFSSQSAQFFAILLCMHCQNESMKFIPKGVRYIPHMVHTLGMFCKHTNNGMLCIPLHGMF